MFLCVKIIHSLFRWWEMSDYKQSINSSRDAIGNTQLQFSGSVGSVVIVMGDKDKDNVVALPGVTVRPENSRKKYRQVQLDFIDDKLAEIKRSYEWLKVMVYKEKGIVYQKLALLSDERLTEICVYLDDFYLEE
jgi:hypothetical protein